MKVREALRMLRQDGWIVVRIRGSHRQLKHSRKPGLVTVTGNESKELPPKTLGSILRQADLEKLNG